MKKTPCKEHSQLDNPPKTSGDELRGARNTMKNHLETRYRPSEEAMKYIASVLRRNGRVVSTHYHVEPAEESSSRDGLESEKEEG